MKIIECPRDAMQGIEQFIPTDKKIEYINSLLEVGFDTLDFGSFVSPKAIPQMRDTAEVYEKINWKNSTTKLLAIVANKRGAEEAVKYEGIRYLGFPMSISETFQQRNTNKSIAEALNDLAEIKNLCVKHDKQLVTYVSMGFGNPYNDPYSPDHVGSFTDILITLGSDIISLADTIGAASPALISNMFTKITQQFPDTEIGVHLHARKEDTIKKLEAAVDAGCKRIDGAMRGFGGCPMAKDELVGNMATELMVSWLDSKNIKTDLNIQNLTKSLAIAQQVFPAH
ncbi:MAG: hydroxymethylglutaryl-CoA lyase [Cyclobacteriaceae bacterium]|nr:hydroxymethylglutaryl-CoA lyase [Cyclobacteriaceae bacterium]